MARSRVLVTMPAYNEADGIEEFLDDLVEQLVALDDYTAELLVVDDCSTDGTAAVVQACARRLTQVRLVRSECNQGHGPTTVKALQHALASGADVIIGVDGDGQFWGRDVAHLVRLAELSRAEVVEGVRTGRDDPWFRVVVSSVTRWLVFLRSGHFPKDANTPLRVYQRAALARLIEHLPADSMVPNLHISALTRELGVAYVEAAVGSRARRGTRVLGSTWGRGQRLPGRRFVRFCLSAARQWAAGGTRRTRSGHPAGRQTMTLADR